MIHQDAIVYGLYALAVLFFSRRARTRYVAIPVGAILLATLTVLVVDSVLGAANAGGRITGGWPFPASTLVANLALWLGVWCGALFFWVPRRD